MSINNEMILCGCKGGSGSGLGRRLCGCYEGLRTGVAGEKARKGGKEEEKDVLLCGCVDMCDVVF